MPRHLPSLKSVTDEANALTSVRLGLAAMVLVAHCWPLGGFSGGFTVVGVEAGGLAVAGFFAISGYLVTASRLKLSGARFAWHRFVRIYPGFWVVLLLIGFVFAPMSTLVDGSYDPVAAAGFVIENATTRMSHWSIAGTLPGAPFPGGGQWGGWDGSLWTLSHEITCYFGIGLWLTVPAVRRTAWLSVLLLAVVAVLAYTGTGSSRFDQTAPLAAMFMAGAVLRLYDSRIRLRGDLALGSTAAVFALAHVGAFTLAALPLAYAVLWAAASAPAWLKGWRQDYSYGVYVYAFPCQQLLTLVGVARYGLGPYLLATVAITSIFAVASWHLVERSCLGLRSIRIPSWGVRRVTVIGDSADSVSFVPDLPGAVLPQRLP